ncbi:permease-like cell division protein FtsX [Actinoplanes sp. NPDC049118]|uniref:permease-like cell division protein FtsX n=1 Tax=Actinoplanes sp. NPDC049118 TaxID=3155769 RepID=UPI0033E82470
MDQNLRSLFERALDDEPVPPGDPARMAMAQGRRIRRRRGLLVGGSAAVAVVAAVVAVNVALGPTEPPRTTSAAAAAMMVPADPACTLPAQDRASDISIFLADDITASQRSGLQAALQADPQVRDLRYDSREEAFTRFKQLWADDPDFVASVSVYSLPESFRMTLAEPSAYPAFAARFQGRDGVDDLVGLACPGAGE